MRYSCGYCKKAYSRSFDLKRHNLREHNPDPMSMASKRRRVVTEESDRDSEISTYESDRHSENSTDESDLPSEISTDETHWEDDNEESDDEEQDEGQESEEEEEEVDDPWMDMADEAIDKYHQDMVDAIAALLNEGRVSVNEARREVYEKYLSRVTRRMRHLLIQFICHSRKMRRDPTYRKIMDTAQRLRDEDFMDYEESVTYAVSKRKLLLERLLRKQLNSDNEDDDDVDE